MKVITAPEELNFTGKTSVFLAGSIENGTSEMWQEEMISQLSDLDVTLVNPRRKAWNASWKQDIENPLFKEQVTWELEALENVDVIAMYFSPGTKSPISLLELGLFAQKKKMIVCCPEGFWRKGNVDVVCERYDVQQVDSLSELIQQIRAEHSATLV